jgi:hypothetical protein
MWQCELTQLKGEGYAQVVGWGHEIGMPYNADQRADIFNNFVGQCIGNRDNSSCENECTKGWEGGILSDRSM